ncbi:YheU family protein [Alkalimarinus sediminis]|uniref:YheU family protein n=1 Tax=Alkalimarinus sediminis TaxID=1632866 RepID=A0A9E8HIW0_9ALTE|nr:YheU family protein [Alkalimarinus sediminis]UZW75204.1 YheU family protein [Alkalimarinus sediminis]
MIIPHDQLSEDAINNLIDEYCMRDWGINETEEPLESRRSQVTQALKSGQLVVLYSEYNQSASLTQADLL